VHILPQGDRDGGVYAAGCKAFGLRLGFTDDAFIGADGNRVVRQFFQADQSLGND